jgi:hypothetical protein
MVVKAMVTLAICSGGNRRDVGWRRHHADPRFVLHTRDMDRVSQENRARYKFTAGSFRVR